MELTIGREQGNQRLQITADNGTVKYYGNPGSVPKSVSRQHCKIQVINENELLITNIKPENKTMVNGLAVMEKRIGYNDLVELGKDKYMLSLSAIVNAFSQRQTYQTAGNQNQQQAPSYSIAHLEKIWNDYNKAKLDAQIQQAKENAISSVTGLFTMAAIVVGFIPGVPLAARIGIYVLAFVLASYFFYNRTRKASYYPKLYNDLDNNLHDNYVCPNPSCRHFLGYQRFEDLEKSKKCPYCGSVFIK